MSLSSEVLAFHNLLYTAGATDTPDAIKESESRLGCLLPALLTDVFAVTSLRRSQQLHLHPLGELAVRDGFLVFGADQQYTWKFAVSLSDLTNEDPDVYQDCDGTSFEPENCTLSQWLKLFWVINRPFEPPCAEVELSNSDIAAWKEFQASGTSCALDEGSVLLLDDLVYQTDMGALGARTDHSLRSFLEESDEMDCADVIWAQEG